MDRGHLGTQKGVAFLHVLCKHHPVVGAADHLSLKMVDIPDFQGSDERADPDAGSPQVVHFVNL